MEKKAYEQIELKTKFEEWTNADLNGRDLVHCTAKRDGLEPFMEFKTPFFSFSQANIFYSEVFFRKTDGEGLMLRATTISTNKMVYDIIYFSDKERCGEMVVEICEVVG